ncbi:MAG: TRAP transporter small permease [Pseudomonadales bacterium]|nr:TRAP transporter small permease [Pseudomonadales bacterium]
MRGLLRLLDRFEEGLLALLLLAMIGLAVTQILLRNLFETGIPWGDDAVRTLVLWVAMVGSMVAAGRGQHIRIDALVRYLPYALRGPLGRLVDLLTALICAALAWFGWEFAALEYMDGLIAFAAVPSWIAVGIIPVAFALIGLRYAIHAVLGRPSLTAEAALDGGRGAS